MIVFTVLLTIFVAAETEKHPAGDRYIYADIVSFIISPVPYILHG